MAGHQPQGSLLGQTVVRELDLHGCTAAQAEQRVRVFILARARDASGRVVRIITGKGTGSEGKPVLRPLVGRLLEKDLDAYVEAVSADVDGGSYLVKLRTHP
jgi:DNA-nicking Smr family endonuclease